MLKRELRAFWSVQILTLLVSLVGAKTVAAQPTYTFAKVADAAQVTNIALATCFAINNQGAVVFITSDGSVWHGNGSTLSQLATPGPTGQPVTVSCPGLNDTGDVAYAFATPAYSALLKQSSGNLTELARSDVPPFFAASGSIGIHSLTNGGASVMAGADGNLYLVPNGTQVFTPGPSDPPLSSVLSGTMNNNQVVAFVASRVVQGVARTGVYRSSGTPLVEDGNTVVPLVLSARPVVNDNNVVAFLGQLNDGTTHVLSTSDGIAFVDHSGQLASDQSQTFSINSSGVVAFVAPDANGQFGVFIGPDSANNKVIAPGDPLDGSTVVNVRLAPESLNDAGQVAFWAELADGRSGVFVASNISPPVASNDTLNVSFNTTASSTLTALDPANLPLAYTIVTNGSKGTATITDAATGAYSYTPAANAIGTDTFTFKANNGVLDSNVATVTIAIAPGGGGNNPPVAMPGGSNSTASVRFDAIGDELSRVTNLPPIAGFTMMGWFRYLGDTNTYSAFLRLGDATTSDGYNMLRCCGNDNNRIGIWVGGGLKLGPAMVRGTWYHLAVTVEGAGPGQVKVYTDGALAITNDGNPIITAQRLSIGNDSHKEWLDGNAASVKIYDVPLSQQDIAREMMAFAPVRTQDLNSWYPLQTAESAATDFSGNGRTLNLTGPLAGESSGPPVLSAVTNESTPLSGVVRATDPDGNPLTYAIVANATNGSVTLDTTSGAYTYTPNPATSGMDKFSFAANDGMLDSNIADVPVLVLPATYPVTATIAGTGTGTVKVTPPGRICSDECNASYQRGESVSFIATESPGSTFVGWTGGCASTASACTISIDGPVNVVATFLVTNRDLLATSVTTPPTVVTPGASFPVTVVTTNQGTVSVGSSSTRFYLSQDPIKDVSDLLLSGTVSVAALNPGSSATGTVTVIIPTTAALGTYRLLACADDRAQVAESSETNNCLASSPFGVQRPDLVEISVMNPPPTTAPGASFNVTDTVENRGLATASSSTTRYYLSSDAMKSADDILVAVTRAVGTLAGGASSTGTKTVVVPAITAVGTYVLIACADDLSTVVEATEGNNCTAAAATLRVGWPDLVEASISNPPANASPGSSFTVTDVVENSGDAPAAASTTRYYLSTDSQKTSGVLLAATRAVGSVAPSGLSSGSKSVVVPTTMALGSYYVLACADDLATVPEIDDTNNCVASTTTVLVGWPDLVISSISNPPAEIAPGKTFSVTSTTLNQGNAIAAPSTTRFYLSADTVRSVDDVILGATRSIPTLIPGAVSSGAVTVPVPTTAAAGAYFVLGCADDLARVAESPANEANNCLASSSVVQVRYPDLVQTAVSDPPASVARGSSVTITDTVTNLGSILVGSTTTRFYLSVDGTKASAVLLGGRSVSSLAVGAARTTSGAFTVPSTAPSGTYYLLACADDTNAAVESNETNNCLRSAGVSSVY